MRSTLNLLFALLLAACNVDDKDKGQNQSTAVIKKDSSGIITSTSINKEEIDQVIFGIYCGECGSNCATMYRYNMMGNQNSLFADYTDSYFNWRNGGEMIFGTEIEDKSKFNIAGDIIYQIPESLLKSIKTRETFGCPDCSDGCGIYFEVKHDTMTKSFNIDHQTSQLTGEIKAFAEYLNETIPKLK